MLFSTPVFLFLFLPVTLLAYALARGSARNGVLLAASLFFYAWGEPFFVLLLLGSIALNYGFGLRVAEGARALHWLAAGVAANLMMLGAFKYAGFFAENLGGLLGALGLPPLPPVPSYLPLGISFFTFQAISYLVDVHRGVAEVQRSPLRVALFIALFPQLVAGPIVRYGTIAKQLGEREHTLAKLDEGLCRFVVGLAKKVVLADPLGIAADRIFALPGGELTAGAAWLGASLFALQIYFDFSGYSDMAIGLGRVFGFIIPENFLHPYTATSVRDFWRRWHVSLSTWFRDYLYLPLGGNRLGAPRTACNLLLVFLLCGLWHGASWTFVVWGLFHGALLSIERLGLGAVLERLPRLVSHVYVVGAVWFGWAIFRAPDLDRGLAHVGAMLGLRTGNLDAALFVDPKTALLLAIGALACVPLTRASRWIPRGLTPTVKTAAVAGLAVVAAAFVATSGFTPFIYFRF